MDQALALVTPSIALYGPTRLNNAQELKFYDSQPNAKFIILQLIQSLNLTLSTILTAPANMHLICLSQ